VAKADLPLAEESERNSKMKRNLSVLAVMVVAFLVFSDQSCAVCPQDPNDLGICDTLYVETFNCDHSYEGTGGYDSVRVAIYVTHDSNTFFWAEYPPSGKWVQDSIGIFTIPLNFWQVGCADSVVFPTNAKWNNKKTDRSSGDFKRSLFRDLINTHISPPETTFNRFADMYELGADDWGCYLDIVRKAPGHVFIALVPNISGGSQRWQEGSRTLLATLTLLVYMDPDCNSTAICFDSTFWDPGSRLLFVRHDGSEYIPRHFLPVCDTIYSVNILCGDCNGDRIIDAADVVYLINYLFVGGTPPDPLCKADVNADDLVNIADVVYLINYLFVQGPPPSPNCCAR
jgi:hypothetical protein